MSNDKCHESISKLIIEENRDSGLQNTSKDKITKTDPNKIVADFDFCQTRNYEKLFTIDEHVKQGTIWTISV